MTREERSIIYMNHSKYLKTGDIAFRGDLSHEDLSEDFLSHVNWKGIVLREANLNKAFMKNADLRSADLSGANLREARMEGANLSKADLRKADLSGADLKGVALVGTNLNEARLTGAKLAGAGYTTETTFPEGFEPEKHEMIWVPKFPGLQEGMDCSWHQDETETPTKYMNCYECGEPMLVKICENCRKQFIDWKVCLMEEGQYICRRCLGY